MLMTMPGPLRACPADLSDHELLELFGALGGHSKVAMRRALALLPEVIRRRLYRKTGCSSPYEYAQKMAGATKDVVDKVLRLHRKIGSMPELWGLLERGVEGWSKLEVVAWSATPDTAAWWAERLQR